jgi:hypothetical protein
MGRVTLTLPNHPEISNTVSVELPSITITESNNEMAQVYRYCMDRVWIKYGCGTLKNAKSFKFF